jgi:hypothetical protein
LPGLLRSHPDPRLTVFRYTARLTLRLEPARESKAELLAKLREAGVFLIDLCLDPGQVRKAQLRRCLPDLLARASALAPDHVILLKAPV